MKTNIVRAALACAVLVLSTSIALAEPGRPIQGIEVGLDHYPPGERVATGVTTDGGKVMFGKLAPGNYVLVIDGPTLIRAMDRLAAPAPAKHDSGPSVSLSVGGLFGGGGSHHSHEGGGPAGGASHSGRIGGIGVDPSDPSGNTRTSGSGMTAGLNVAVGDVNGDGTPDSVVRPGDQIDRITFTLVVTGSPGGSVSSRAPDAGGSTFSSETPYCRDTAGQGMRLGFKISENESPRPQDVTFTITFAGSLANGPQPQ